MYVYDLVSVCVCLIAPKRSQPAPLPAYAPDDDVEQSRKRHAPCEGRGELPRVGRLALDGDGAVVDDEQERRRAEEEEERPRVHPPDGRRVHRRRRVLAALPRAFPFAVTNHGVGGPRGEAAAAAGGGEAVVEDGGQAEEEGKVP